MGIFSVQKSHGKIFMRGVGGEVGGENGGRLASSPHVFHTHSRMQVMRRRRWLSISYCHV